MINKINYFRQEYEPTPDDENDICVCGDYRKDHDNGGKCRVCGDSRAPYDRCQKFKLAEEPTKDKL